MPEGRLATQVFPGQPKPGPDDLQATWQGQWDSRFLYLHLSVDDANRRTVDAGKPTQFWQGDGVSFEFGPDVSTLPPTTKPRSGKDFHVMVGVTPLGGLASFNMANAGAIRAGGALTDVILSRTDRPGGYEVEMAVPWTDVGLTTPPARGSLWAMNVNVSDAVNSTTTWRLARMISTNPVRTGTNQGLPATWQHLVLDDRRTPDAHPLRTGAPTMAGHVYALLVGIDAYSGVVPPLSGCVNDVTAFGDVLRGRVAAEELSMVTVTDEDATRETVTREFAAHLGQAGADDVALFYYSGHGAYQEAPQELWDFEPDHQNETLVLVDSREPGGWDLADKELAVLIAQVAANGCHLLVVLDCCHSGDATRDVDGGRATGPARPAAPPDRELPARHGGAGRSPGRCRAGRHRHARPRPGAARAVDAAGREARAARCLPLLGEGQGDQDAGSAPGRPVGGPREGPRAVGGQARPIATSCSWSPRRSRPPCATSTRSSRRWTRASSTAPSSGARSPTRRGR